MSITRRQLLASPSLLAIAAADSRRGLALNEDNSHFFYTRAGQPLTEQLVDSWVDQYAGTQVRELFLSPNAMRTSYDSKVWDPIWRGYDPKGPDDQPLFAYMPEQNREGARKWVHTAWELAQKKIDVYARWIARARKVGLSPWLSMRMNDIHEVNDRRSFMHSEFWRGHPEFARVPYRDGFREKALDYGRAEVRAHHMALVKELLERYDPDGIELDWMRFGFHFRPGQEALGAELLTGFMREVRALARTWEKKRGHRIRVGVRVPSRPHTAVGLGMDAVRWAKEGLADMIVITPFFTPIEFDMPVELWKRLLAGTNVTLATGLEIVLQPFRGFAKPGPNSIETVRGAASALLDRGADRIYLFNYMDSQTAQVDLENYPKLLREAGELTAMAGKPRRHVVTYSDTFAPGEPVTPPQLPVACTPGKLTEFRIPTGPKPARSAFVLLGIEGADAASAAGWEVRLNGEPCAAAGTRAMSAPSPGPMAAFGIPLAAMNRGYNLVEVVARSSAKLVWVEISADFAA